MQTFLEGLDLKFRLWDAAKRRFLQEGGKICFFLFKQRQDKQTRA